MTLPHFGERELELKTDLDVREAPVYFGNVLWVPSS